MTFSYLPMTILTPMTLHRTQNYGNYYSSSCLGSQLIVYFQAVLLTKMSLMQLGRPATNHSYQTCDVAQSDVIQVGQCLLCWRLWSGKTKQVAVKCVWIGEEQGESAWAQMKHELGDLSGYQAAALQSRLKKRYSVEWNDKVRLLTVLRVFLVLRKWLWLKVWCWMFQGAQRALKMDARLAVVSSLGRKTKEWMVNLNNFWLQR